MSEEQIKDQNPTTKEAGDFQVGDITKSRGRPTEIKKVWREGEKVFMKMKLMETPFSNVSLDGVHETFVMPYLGTAGDENETGNNRTSEGNGGDSGTVGDSGKTETEEVQDNSRSESTGTEEGIPASEEKTEGSTETESSEEGKAELKSTLSAAVRGKKRGR